MVTLGGPKTLLTIFCMKCRKTFEAYSAITSVCACGSRWFKWDDGGTGWFGGRG